MEEEPLNIDELQWKDVPIKYCAFKRACKEFLFMASEDMEFIITGPTLGGLSEEDRDIIMRVMSPTLEECKVGSRDTKTTYLQNLMMLIVYRYKQITLMELKSSSHLKEEYGKRSYEHYEALRNLKEALILGRSLDEGEMPEVKAT